MQDQTTCSFMALMWQPHTNEALPVEPLRSIVMQLFNSIFTAGNANQTWTDGKIWGVRSLFPTKIEAKWVKI